MQPLRFLVGLSMLALAMGRAPATEAVGRPVRDADTGFVGYRQSAAPM